MAGKKNRKKRRREVEPPSNPKTNTPTTHLTSLSWLLSTLLSIPSSSIPPTVAPESTGPTSTPLANSLASCSSAITLSIDVTDVALEWAERNVKDNPHISELIEVRRIETGENTLSVEDSRNGRSSGSESKVEFADNTKYYGPPVLVGVVRDAKKFDFCMCNPPFFKSMDEAGLNPKTSCGGTPEEMVCPGGEEAFITRIIEDSFLLKQTFRWYTTMIGSKSNLKFLMSKLREV